LSFEERSHHKRETARHCATADGAITKIRRVVNIPNKASRRDRESGLRRGNRALTTDQRIGCDIIYVKRETCPCRCLAHVPHRFAIASTGLLTASSLAGRVKRTLLPHGKLSDPESAQDRTQCSCVPALSGLRSRIHTRRMRAPTWQSSPCGARRRWPRTTSHRKRAALRRLTGRDRS